MAKLVQHGGEGGSSYKGTKSDMNLPQHGGEGKNMGKRSGNMGFTPHQDPNSKYCGPGRYLKIES